MYNMYTAKGGGSRCTICTPKMRVPMDNMYIAQGGGGSQCTICTVPKGWGPNVRYVQCPRGGVPMYHMYIAQGESPHV